MRCLYTETKPDLHIDAEGVSSACRSYEQRKEIDWNARKQELLDILNRYLHCDPLCVVYQSTRNIERSVSEGRLVNPAEVVRKGGAKYFIGLAVRNTPAGECLAETDMEQIAG